MTILLKIWLALFFSVLATVARAEVTEIALGVSHSCALLTSGAIKCWGAGSLGDGTTTDRTTPVDVSGITTATSLALGGYHSCALLTGGAIKCWGSNNYGQLGDGTTTDRTTPVDVSGITTATSLALGRYHSCALLTGGAIKCWGYNNYGQLGDGTTLDRTTPVDVSGSPCDASAAPTNGGGGDCTSSLASGSTCQPTCESGYTVSGTSSCSSVGTLTAATCAVSPSPPPVPATSTPSPPTNTALPPPPPSHAPRLAGILMVLVATTINMVFSL